MHPEETDSSEKTCRDVESHIMAIPKLNGTFPLAGEDSSHACAVIRSQFPKATSEMGLGILFMSIVLTVAAVYYSIEVM